MVFASEDRPEPAGNRKPDWVFTRRAAPSEEDSATTGPQLSWDEVGFVLTAISDAPRQWRNATQSIRKEFALSSRGPWILGLIYSGQVVFPSDLARVFQCVPSLITGELNRLIDHGLVATRKHELDGRQLELMLTLLGEEVQERIGKTLVEMVRQRLAGYTKDQIMFCARLLRDFAKP